MNIKTNILNYLYDRDYCLCVYDDYIYIFNYLYLNSFNDSKIVVKLKDKEVNIIGSNLLIVRITKEELLIKGIVSKIEVINT